MDEYAPQPVLWALEIWRDLAGNTSDPEVIKAVLATDLRDVASADSFFFRMKVACEELGYDEFAYCVGRYPKFREAVSAAARILGDDTPLARYVELRELTEFRVSALAALASNAEEARERT